MSKRPVGPSRSVVPTPRARPSGSFEVRRSTHHEMLALRLALTDEFAPSVAAGTVLRIVAEARERLLAAGVREGLVLSVESMARARLGRRLADAPTSTGASG